VANPTSFILALKMMFDWLGEKYQDTNLIVQSIKIEKAIDDLFVKNIKTIDIGGKLSTKDFSKKFISLITDIGYD
jgi:3-isopropylmalate dehydrogenase